MEAFFKVKTSDEVLEIIDRFGPSGKEAIPLEDALDRVLSRDVISHENLPGFARSTMDGYAVKAGNTFGAGDGLPALFEIAGEVLMGRPTAEVLRQGQAIRISTGGMLPEGADGVVMLEHCVLPDELTLEVTRPISPLENVVQAGDDLKEGAIALKRGRCLRPQDLGLLAGVGVSQVPVYKRPRVAIISSGEEIASINEELLQGRVRDINRYTLSAFCRRMGAEPLFMGICADDYGLLKGLAEKALALADTLWISGGSSVGTRDLTLKVFEKLPDFELLVHGISIRPGKPTIIARSGSKAVIGLPGHVASALIVAEIFLAQLLLNLSGYTRSWNPYQNGVEAELARNIDSGSGREDYIRVKLVPRGTTLIAEPVFGKSGLISPLVESHGLIRVDMNTEGLYQGQKVRVILFGS